MKIFRALGSGGCRSAKAWKGILIYWIGFLIPVMMMALFFKSAMKTGLGRSMITDRLRGGIDIEVLSDLGVTIAVIFRALASWAGFMIIAGIALNAFLTGGLFTLLKGTTARISEFFSSSAKYFLSFIGITIIITVILIFIGLLVIVLPVSLAAQSDAGSESLVFITVISGISVFILCSALFLLVADYARAWQVTNDNPGCFNALGFGFARTFGTIGSSFPMMIMILIASAFYSLLMMLIAGRLKPVSGGGVFLFFLISQVLILVRIYIKVWRYGSVTSLMEINNIPEPLPSETTNNINK